MLSKESHSHIVNIIVLVTILTQMESMFNIFTTTVIGCSRYVWWENKGETPAGIWTQDLHYHLSYWSQVEEEHFIDNVDT